MKSLLGGANDADVMAWADDANNVVTLEARRNVVNAVLAACA